MSAMAAPAADERTAVVLEYAPDPPFDFLKTLTVLDLVGREIADVELGETTLSLAVWLADPSGATTDASAAGPAAAVATLRSVGTASAPRLAVHLEGLEREPTEPERRRVGHQLEGLLGLSDDLEPFHDLAREDDAYWRVIQPLVGARRIGVPTAFEGIVWTILRQRQFPNVARARLRRVREAFGAEALPADGSGTARYAFPGPGRLAEVPLGRLAPLIKKRRKARYVRSAAKAFAERASTEPGFARLAPVDEVRSWLESIRGVGPWSARTFLSRALARPNVDLILREGRLEGYWQEVLARIYGPAVDAERVRREAERYGDYEELWLWHAATAHRLRAAALANG